MIMKNVIFLLVFIFGFTIFNAQEVEKLIKNNNEFFTGKIDNSTNLKVLFETISTENQEKDTYKVFGFSDVEGTKAYFEGTIILDAEKTQNSKDQSKIYDLKLSEKGNGKHNGIFSGELTLKKSADKNQLKFEGTWTNYGNTLSFPFYFNN
ncbi:hypothetical protein DRF58_02520 [Epilithonimonas hispanica]|uniref:Uncharacterized protein n=2 Tax=Epilithonimonas hispanica TaxID=358687 RepID=A0A3D9D3C1_9FLAO|nr:hypothetical protein DRF58_02520 [Epilithonimonas hispanica]